MGACALGPYVAPHGPNDRFPDHLSAPPMRPRVVRHDGRIGPPVVYPWRLVDRLERRYELDVADPLRLRWFWRGAVVRAAGPDGRTRPLFLLGTDSFGRDVLARLLYGGRISLGVAALATLGAVALGLVIGGLAGLAHTAWPLADEALTRATELILVLPTIYVVLVVRAAMPLVVSPLQTFVMLSGVLALAGWPYVARGVRAIVAAERQREYALAAESLGAGAWRLLWRHLLPATRGYVAAQATVLLPAFLAGEATLSFVGFGFPDTVPSWGTMLQEASNAAAIADFPWVLVPALAIFLVVLAANLLVRPGDTIRAI